jgi:hypothetical protein
MDSVAPALIGFSSAVLVGFFGHFVAEDYRRFRDSQSIAAALAGEMSSIISSLQDLHLGLSGMKVVLDREQPIHLPEIPDQSSSIFEANAEKIGLLGADFAGKVAFTYDQIRAFRTSFQLLSKNHTTSPLLWSSAIVGRCLRLIDVNQAEAMVLVEDLKNYSKSSYAKSRTVGVVVMTGLTLLSLSSLFGAVFCLRS